jgi:transmembrane sensor
MAKNEEDNKELRDQLPTASEIEDIRCAFQHAKMTVPDVDAEWDRVSRGMKDDGHRSGVYRWVAILAAASVALFFILQLGFNHRQSCEVFTYDENKGGEVTMSTAESGTSVVKKAVLTFAGTPKSASVDASAVSISTPRGKDCHLVLPDGTKVWLNAESSIEFPKSFTGRERLVRVSGEAFFEVTKDKKHPFIVNTDYFSTKVLGTKFNIRAYSEKDASLVLVEGHVVAESPSHSFVEHLLPGDKMQCLGTDKVDMSKVDTYSYTQNKDGYFYFDNETLLRIMVELGRWYNKTIVFENEKCMNMKLHFVTMRHQPIADIISSLNDIDGVDIAVGNNELTVK